MAASICRPDFWTDGRGCLGLRRDHGGRDTPRSRHVGPQWHDRGDSAREWRPAGNPKSQRLRHHQPGPDLTMEFLKHVWSPVGDAVAADELRAFGGVFEQLDLHAVGIAYPGLKGVVA